MLELLDLVPLRFAFLIPILNGIGYMLKHGIIRLPNFTIPYLIFVIALTMSSALGSVMSPLEGWAYWVDVFVRYGVINGFQLTVISCGGYEAVRHVCLSRKRRSEVNMLKNKPIVKIMVSFLVASAIFTLISLALGSGLFGAFCKITDGWIFGILFFAVYDIEQRLLKEKSAITKLYIAMQVLLFISVVSFAFASMTAVFQHFVFGFAIAMVSLFAAGLLPTIVRFIHDKKLGPVLANKQRNEEKIQGEWEDLRATLGGLSADEKAKKLEEGLPFRLKNDSLVDDVDFERSMVEVDTAAGVCAATVEKAEELGADPTAIEDAKTYITGLV